MYIKDIHETLRDAKTWTDRELVKLCSENVKAIKKVKCIRRPITSTVKN